MRKAGAAASGAMLGWCILEVSLRAATGTLGGAGSAVGAGAVAAASLLLLRRAG
ncbi:hypothetical protein [Tepidiforma bonchosmolovskayae]|uniref:hypothetical protein n=1 Tax=Tepidiforma bonchosmolovskayae TaxID=2601677 RepID=UPI0017881E15|nr:hypothetical protein [Tepidiforma bonchosmolovskayae]